MSFGFAFDTAGECEDKRCGNRKGEPKAASAWQRIYQVSGCSQYSLGSDTE
jgi:hypothetical protein